MYVCMSLMNVCNVMEWNGMLCCVLFCDVMLCYVMLCCTITYVRMYVCMYVCIHTHLCGLYAEISGCFCMTLRVCGIVFARYVLMLCIVVKTVY